MGGARAAFEACRHCGDTKPLDDFYRDSAARDSRRPECKLCTAARRKAWYAANRAREIDRVKEWRESNREHFNAWQRRNNARPERKRAMRDIYYRRTFGISADDVDGLLAEQGAGVRSAEATRTGREPAPRPLS